MFNVVAFYNRAGGNYSMGKIMVMANDIWLSYVRGRQLKHMEKVREIIKNVKNFSLCIRHAACPSTTPNFTHWAHYFLCWH